MEYLQKLSPGIVSKCTKRWEKAFIKVVSILKYFPLQAFQRLCFVNVFAAGGEKERASEEIKQRERTEVICCVERKWREKSRQAAVGKFQIRAATAAERWVLACSRFVFSVLEQTCTCIYLHRARAQSSHSQIEVNANSVTAHLFANGWLVGARHNWKCKKRGGMRNLCLRRRRAEIMRDGGGRSRCWLHVESSALATIRLFARLPLK